MINYDLSLLILFISVMSEQGKAIGQEVAKSAEEASKGQCLFYVRKGIQKAKKQPQVATGINSAKDAGPWLQKQGFEKVTPSTYKDGDVMIIKDTPNHKHGHIQVYYQGKWYSDFKQKTQYPWVNSDVKAVYRVKEPISGVSAGQNSHQSSSFKSSHSQTSNRTSYTPHPPTNFQSSSSNGWGLSNDRSNYGYTANNGTRTSIGYNNGVSLKVQIPCQIM